MEFLSGSIFNLIFCHMFASFFFKYFLFYCHWNVCYSKCSHDNWEKHVEFPEKGSLKISIYRTFVAKRNRYHAFYALGRQIFHKNSIDYFWIKFVRFSIKNYFFESFNLELFKQFMAKKVFKPKTKPFENRRSCFKEDEKSFSNNWFHFDLLLFSAKQTFNFIFLVFRLPVNCGLMLFSRRKSFMTIKNKQKVIFHSLRSQLNFSWAFLELFLLLRTHGALKSMQRE